MPFLSSKITDRSQIVKQNALGALMIRCFTMLIDFAKVPILLSFLDPEHYGVYITISSIVYWSHNFDFGLGTGLRYKLTEALSLNKIERSKDLVSTAYISMTVIMLGVFLIGSPILYFLDWSSILNTSSISSTELLLSIIFVLGVYLIQFVLELVSYILQADQKAAMSTIFKPIANLITLILILILGLFSYTSLFLACVAMCVPIVVVLLCANIYFFFHRYRTISPSFKNFSFKKVKEIYSLGVKYFVGQLSTLVVFNTSSLLITYFVSPADTAIYNAAWTYFGVLVMFNNMMLQPLVAAITDAYVKDDYTWIKNIFKTVKKYSLGLSIISLLMLIASPLVFDIWLGGKLDIPMQMCIVMTIYFIICIWVSPYNYFLSGVGKLNASVRLSIAKIIIYIPIAICSIKLFGTIGLIGAIILVNTLPNLILSVYQYRLIISRRATGIWNK